MKQSVTPTAIKSSKESFQQFRKAALEKKEREKALQKKWVQESEMNAPKTRYLGNFLYLFQYTCEDCYRESSLKVAKTTCFNIYIQCPKPDGD